MDEKTKENENKNLRVEKKEKEESWWVEEEEEGEEEAWKGKDNSLNTTDKRYKHN